MQDTLTRTGGCRCLELRCSRAGPGAEEGRSSPSKWAVGVCTEHLGDPMLSRQRCLTQGSAHIPLRPQPQGDSIRRRGQRFWSDTLLCLRDEFTSRAFGFHEGVTRWISADLLLSWLSKAHSCTRARSGTLVQEMLAELQESFSIERELTSYPCFCPRVT